MATRQNKLEENGRIEGLVHIPVRELAQHTDLLLSLGTPIVAYRGSGWRSTIAMTQLETLGWTDVKSMKCGSIWVPERSVSGFYIHCKSPDAADIIDPVRRAGSTLYSDAEQLSRQIDCIPRYP